MTRKSNPRIVSFSGIDGAGKTTQLIEFKTWLRDSGVSTTLLTFWDDVVAFPRLREFLSLKAFKGDSGVGSPEKPLRRRDKNVTAWPVTAMRFFLYAADAVNLHLAVRKLRKTNTDVVIFDRYIYDELANLPLQSFLTRAFLWLIAEIVPQPDIAYVIDADPLAAFTRKPEYPLEFLRRNREAYLRLARLVGGTTVIEAASIETMGMRIKKRMLQELFGSDAEFYDLPVLQ
ncbi:MAG TPA: thymidylate kinase [Terriglobales bacterium]|jgi:thymidylate kinase|nr:thymidylate kinase [Terriglobales bacterium]